MNETRLKPYVAFSVSAGPEEGAALIFAPTAREARRLAWGTGWLSEIDDWLDLGVRLIKESADVLPLADQEKLKVGEAHVIDSPTHCAACGMWGWGLDGGMCGYCGEYPGDDIVRLFRPESEAK